MSLPYTHLLPRRSFYHIGLMMLVMGFMTFFSLIGLLSIQSITAGWYKDVTNSLTIEIPATDDDAKTVLSSLDIDQAVKNIQSVIANDPIIQSFIIHRHDRQLVADASALNLPLPAFITLSLNPQRADNAEGRVIRNIQNIVPQAIITNAETWQKDIDRTALSLQILFGGLAMSLIIISILMIYAIIAAQLKAHEQTVTLIHLMGADKGAIAGLFQKGLFMPLMLGTLCGISIAFIGLFPFLSLIQIEQGHITLIAASMVIFTSYLLLGLTVTRLSVKKLLWGLP